MKTFYQFFNEEQTKYLILLPGGYKPPTKGHMHMIESYDKDPSVSKVIVLIGPKEREGITREQALKVFDLYQISRLQKVVVEKSDFANPMQAAFEYVENDPRAQEYAGLTFAIGASDKGDDAIRSKKFVEYFRSNPGKLRSNFKVGIPNIVKALQENETNVSATLLRLAIQNKDVKSIANLIPNYISPQEFLKIFNK